MNFLGAQEDFCAPNSDCSVANNDTAKFLRHLGYNKRHRWASSRRLLHFSLHLNFGVRKWWAVQDLNLRPSGCKPDALTAELTAHVFEILQVKFLEC